MPLRLYVLVDALLYGCGQTIERPAATIGLFDATQDASLADAGPWLIDFEKSAGERASIFVHDECRADGVSWPAGSRGASVDSGDGFGKKQVGTIIVSVTDAVFSADNPEHVEVAYRIEIRLVDQDLLPSYADI